MTKIRFFSDDDGSELSMTGVRICLPDGHSFSVLAEPGREDSAVFILPAGTPNDSHFKTFVIEPGASNLFSVRVSEFPRRED